MVLESVKVALDPSPVQERLLLSHAGAARFAFNAGLAHVKACIEADAKPEWSLYGLRRWWNANKDTLAVSDDGVIWWGENSKEAYSSGLEALAKGLTNWSKSRKGDRKGHRVGFPRFKAKDRSTPRFAYTTGFRLIEGDPKALRLPKVGRVHCMENVTARVGDAKVLRMTVSQRAGRWYAALTVEREDKPVAKAPKGGAVGVDLGIKTLATLSDGTVIENPRPLKKTERRLKRAQKALSRKAILSLSERVFHCDACGLVMDRDLNAAVNILVAGSAPETLNAHRETVSRGGQPGRATQVPVKCEPSVGGNVVSDLERVPARTPCKLQQSSLQRAKKGDQK